MSTVILMPYSPHLPHSSMILPSLFSFLFPVDSPKASFFPSGYNSPPTLNKALWMSTYTVVWFTMPAVQVALTRCLATVLLKLRRTRSQKVSPFRDFRCSPPSFKMVYLTSPSHRLSNNNTTPPWTSSIWYGHVHLWPLPSMLCLWVGMLLRERTLPIRRTRSNMMVAAALLLIDALLTPLQNDLFWSWFIFVVLWTGIRAGFFNWNLCFSRQRCQMFSRICRQWQWISFHHELLYRVSWEVL